MSNISRRTLIQTSSALGVAGAVTAASAPIANAAPAFIPNRGIELTHGVATGDVTDTTAVLWARTSGHGQLFARIKVPNYGTFTKWTTVTPRNDYTGHIRFFDLKPGETYEYEMFGVNATRPSEPIKGAFRTAPATTNRSVSFVWTGDTAGQGWGRHTERGMWAYSAMAATDPDFFIHSGDTVYSDGPMKPEVELPDGRVWTNVISDGVEKVAETQDEFWGRHRYNMGDEHVQGLLANVPVIAQWDDHETVNNWYPGEVLNDPRYTQENRVDVLARRARQAFTDYFPMDTRTRDHKGNIYGKFSRGPHMDVFVIDMRSFRGPNTENLQTEESRETVFLGQRQVDWLISELKASKATWKVIASDMPIGLVVGDGDKFENMANANDGAPLGRELEFARLLKAVRDVPNIVFFTADVHYCAAHHYSPERAGFTEFTEFWEFVAGPINAGTFGPNTLDGTFGPKVEFFETGPRVNASPLEGGQFFGHTRVDGATGEMTIRLINADGQVRYTKTLSPKPVRG